MRYAKPLMCRGVWRQRSGSAGVPRLATPARSSRWSSAHTTARPRTRPSPDAADHRIALVAVSEPTSSGSAVAGQIRILSTVLSASCAPGPGCWASTSTATFPSRQAVRRWTPCSRNIRHHRRDEIRRRPRGRHPAAAGVEDFRASDSTMSSWTGAGLCDAACCSSMKAPASRCITPSRAIGDAVPCVQRDCVSRPTRPIDALTRWAARPCLRSSRAMAPTWAPTRAAISSCSTFARGPPVRRGLAQRRTRRGLRGCRPARPHRPARHGLGRDQGLLLHAVQPQPTADYHVSGIALHASIVSQLLRLALGKPRRSAPFPNGRRRCSMP